MSGPAPVVVTDNRPVTATGIGEAGVDGAAMAVADTSAAAQRAKGKRLCGMVINLLRQATNFISQITL